MLAAAFAGLFPAAPSIRDESNGASED